MAVGTARPAGPKLAPILSPRRRHAGAVGGTLGGVIAALALGKFVLNRQGWSFSPVSCCCLCLSLQLSTDR